MSINRISSIIDKASDINHRLDELNNRKNKIKETPWVGNLIVWTDYNKVIGEWNALMDEEANPKLDISTTKK